MSCLASTKTIISKKKNNAKVFMSIYDEMQVSQFPLIHPTVTNGRVLYKSLADFKSINIFMSNLYWQTFPPTSVTGEPRKGRASSVNKKHQGLRSRTREHAPPASPHQAVTSN